MTLRAGYAPNSARVIPCDPAAIVVEVHGCKHTVTVDEAIELRRSLYDAISEANVENVTHNLSNNRRKYWWQGR